MLNKTWRGRWRGWSETRKLINRQNFRKEVEDVTQLASSPSSLPIIVAFVTFVTFETFVTFVTSVAIVAIVVIEWAWKKRVCVRSGFFLWRRKMNSSPTQLFSSHSISPSRLAVLLPVAICNNCDK